MLGVGVGLLMQCSVCVSELNVNIPTFYFPSILYLYTHIQTHKYRFKYIHATTTPIQPHIQTTPYSTYLPTYVPTLTYSSLYTNHSPVYQHRIWIRISLCTLLEHNNTGTNSNIDQPHFTCHRPATSDLSTIQRT